MCMLLEMKDKHLLSYNPFELQWWAVLEIAGSAAIVGRKVVGVTT